MASDKQVKKWTEQAAKISDNPKYIQAYVEYKQLAKKADQRLVRLEALSHDKHFEGVLEFSYKSAIRDIKSWGGDRRFNTAPPTKLTELNAKIADIEKFLLKPTSNKGEILKIYKKRADTFNVGNKEGKGGFGKEYGVKFTWQDIANYYEDKKGQREAVKLSSQTEVRALATLKRLHNMELRSEDKSVQNLQENVKKLKSHDYRNAEERKAIEDEIEAAQKKISRVTGKDRILATNVEKLLKQGLDYNKLMGGN